MNGLQNKSECLFQKSTTERLDHINREWAEIQDFVAKFGFRKMQPEKEVNLLDVIREFNRFGIRYLIIECRGVTTPRKVPNFWAGCTSEPFFMSLTRQYGLQSIKV